jgi:hypothetical protein
LFVICVAEAEETDAERLTRLSPDIPLEAPPARLLKQPGETTAGHRRRVAQVLSAARRSLAFALDLQRKLMYMSVARDEPFVVENPIQRADRVNEGFPIKDFWFRVWEAEAACLAVGVPILPVSSGRRSSRSRSFGLHSRIHVGTKIWARFLSDEGSEPITDQQFAGVVRESDKGTASDIYWCAAGDTMERLSRIRVILSRRGSANYDSTGRPVQGLSLYLFWRAYGTAPGLGPFFWVQMRELLLPHFDIDDRLNGALFHSRMTSGHGEDAGLRYVMHFVRAARQQCFWLGW